MVLRGFIWLFLSTLCWLSNFNGPNHQASSRLFLVLFPFLSRAGLFLLLAVGLTSANKLSLLLYSDFASSMATLASEALLLSGVFLPFMGLALFWSWYNCWSCATDIESYSSLEYFFNSTFPLKVLQLLLVFCLLAGLFWEMNATFTLGDCAFSVNVLGWERKVMTASKFF